MVRAWGWPGREEGETGESVKTVAGLRHGNALSSHALPWLGPLPLGHCHPEGGVEHSGQGHGHRARLPGLQVPEASFTSWVNLGKLLTLPPSVFPSEDCKYC